MNQVKTALLMVAMTVLLVLFSRLVFGSNFVIPALLFSVVINGAAYWFSDRIALAAAHAQEVSEAEAPMLHRLADRLAAQYRVPKPKVYVSPDPSPNAFATGRNPSHAAICVNQGLLRILDEEELYGVLAHEFAHVRNRDILISSIVAVMAGAITVLANIAQWGLMFGGYGGGRDERDQGAGGLIGGLLMIILAPIAAMLIQLAVSRSREFEADHTGAEVSGDPLALASALRKLQRGAQAVPAETAPAFAHLYIVNPLSGNAMGNLFSTHPPIDERIRRLEAMAGGMRRAS